MQQSVIYKMLISLKSADLCFEYFKRSEWWR